MDGGGISDERRGVEEDFVETTVDDLGAAAFAIHGAGEIAVEAFASDDDARAVYGAVFDGTESA